MKVFGFEREVDFLGARRIAIAISLVFLSMAAASLGLRGLNLGIDFTGGTLIEVQYPEAVELDQVRGALRLTPYGGAIVQYFGTARDVLIRVPPVDGVEQAQISNEVLAALKSKQADVEMRRVEFVGPAVGEELTEKGGLAMIWALIAILIYVGLRFELRFSVGAVAALMHDVLFTLGFFSLFQIEFDLTVLAALLAVIGYSLNDTIVVFDRIRENFRKMRKGTPEQVMNRSINQTISRTIITSLTTLLVLLSLLVFGGEAVDGFALALLVGVVVGTYSSIYVASSATLMLGVSRADLIQVEQEQDTQP